jgi:hypothetical protein
MTRLRPPHLDRGYSGQADGWRLMTGDPPTPRLPPLPLACVIQ